MRKRKSASRRKELADDGCSAKIYDADNELVLIEYYEPTGVFPWGESLVDCRIETPSGELWRRHVTHRISDTACDIHVTDADGTLLVILHHSDIDKGEPCTIREEWFDR